MANVRKSYFTNHLLLSIMIISDLGRVSDGTGCIISEAQCKMAINAGLLFKIIKISRWRQGIKPSVPRGLYWVWCSVRLHWLHTLRSQAGAPSPLGFWCTSGGLSHIALWATMWMTFYYRPLARWVAVASCGCKSSCRSTFPVSSFSFSSTL